MCTIYISFTTTALSCRPVYIVFHILTFVLLLSSRFQTFYASQEVLDKTGPIRNLSPAQLDKMIREGTFQTSKQEHHATVAERGHGAETVGMGSTEVCARPSCNQMVGMPGVKLKPCAKCRLTSYCSRTCQKLDYRRHKPECTRLSGT
jgi:hypothetical protein